MSIALRSRSESVVRLVTPGEPTLAQMRRDGKASAARIAASEATISRTSRDILSEWFDQAHRLAIAREHHGLRGTAFRGFAKSIRVDGSDAFKLEQLDGHRETVFQLCEKMAIDARSRGTVFRWPSWRKALEITLPHKVPTGRWDMAPASIRNNPWGRLTTKPGPNYVQDQDDQLDDVVIGDEWQTPQHLFRFLNSLYVFTVDVAASESNTKCKRFWTRDTDGLARTWKTTDVHWMNHPYSQSALWVRKAHEASKRGVVTVALLPNRSATGWYRDYVVPSALIVQLHGRIPFYRENSAAPYMMSGAPFASLVAIWPQSAGKRILKFTKPVATVIMDMPSLD
jgi:site-specific DNA-methyltransferase (adenine-specific)